MRCLCLAGRCYFQSTAVTGGQLAVKEAGSSHLVGYISRRRGTGGLAAIVRVQVGSVEERCSFLCTDLGALASLLYASSAPAAPLALLGISPAGCLPLLAGAASWY